jgi:23S rRNA pseudouridine1911/1915/1917 synthase
MYRDIKLLVDRKYHQKRIDFFLKEKFPDATRQNIRNAFLNRSILLNGKEARKGEILSEGDTVHLKELKSKKDIKYWPNLIYGPKVIFKDAHLAALYKPPFMHTLPINYGEKDTLANYAAYMFPGDLDDDFITPPLFLSRLDYETSGLVLLARNGDVYQMLKEFQDRGEILKNYGLIVKGEVNRELVVTNAIITTGGGKVKVDRKRDFGDEIYHTKFVPEKIFKGYSLIRAEIRKGRMHQIRAHASFSGFPIVGDLKYGGDVVPPMNGLPLRPLLHSAVVDFTHTLSNVRLKINCPYPEDLYRVLDYLQEFSDSSR